MKDHARARQLRSAPDCDHLAVEENRIEEDGYYKLYYVCVGCGRVVEQTPWLKLWNPDEEE